MRASKVGLSVGQLLEKYTGMVLRVAKDRYPGAKCNSALF